MSNEIAGVAKRATHRIVMEAEASRRVELANQLWFLWIESYLIATGERHNSYDYACDLAEERAAGRGRSFSVGFEVEVREGRVWISEVRDERLRLAGLVAGDEVVRLDDREIDGLTLPELQRYWLSLEPFSFTVVARRADELFRVAGESVPTRHSTLVWSVHGETGYVRIRTFSRSSAIELRRALRRLESAEARRLVLDVRGNPGGSLSADLVDMFFKPGQTIVSYLDHGAAEATDLGATVEYRGLPTAVLVDRRSASMAEVLAAAFRTHERGPVVGEKTFGKGAGQRVHAVGEEGQLNLVERTYFYPGTRESWDGTGITPTLAIEMGQEEWERLQPYVDSPLLRLDEQWELDPVLRAAEERLKERP